MYMSVSVCKQTNRHRQIEQYTQYTHHIYTCITYLRPGYEDGGGKHFPRAPKRLLTYGARSALVEEAVPVSVCVYVYGVVERCV